MATVYGGARSSEITVAEDGKKCHVDFRYNHNRYTLIGKIVRLPGGYAILHNDDFFYHRTPSSQRIPSHYPDAVRYGYFVRLNSGSEYDLDRACIESIHILSPSNQSSRIPWGSGVDDWEDNWHSNPTSEISIPSPKKQESKDSLKMLSKSNFINVNQDE